MSFGGGGGGYQGGRTRMKTNVVLNVYDLSPANDYLCPIGLGLHHSGVEIMGTEYSYAGGAGVFEQRPREVPNAKFRESIDMGHFDGGSSELRSTLDELKGDFHGDSYNLIRKNCNHFANALVWALLRRPIPGHVNRLADLGSCCGCLLPKKMLEDSPVHAPGQGGGGASGGSSGGFQAIGRAGGGAAAASGGTSAFAGSGNTLGGTSSPSSGGGGLGITGWIGRGNGGGGSSSSRNGGTPADDLTDRREKARKAALARLGGGAGAEASGDGGASASAAGSPSGTEEGYKRS